VYIVTDGHDYSTRQIYEWIAAALGRAVPRWTVPMWLLRGLAFVGDILGRLCGRRVGFDRDALDKLFGSACYSSRKLVEQLGYQPRHALEQEMPALVADSLASCKSG
jgi:nucleoside-diphosphate-sugar epimerase